MKPKVHRRDIRLMVNAGINIPVCQANSKAINLMSSNWKLTTNMRKVNCKHCKRLFSQRYGWAK